MIGRGGGQAGATFPAVEKNTGAGRLCADRHLHAGREMPREEAVFTYCILGYCTVEGTLGVRNRRAPRLKWRAPGARIKRRAGGRLKKLGRGGLVAPPSSRKKREAICGRRGRKSAPPQQGAAQRNSRHMRRGGESLRARKQPPLPPPGEHHPHTHLPTPARNMRQLTSVSHGVALFFPGVVFRGCPRSMLYRSRNSAPPPIQATRHNSHALPRPTRAPHRGPPHHVSAPSAPLRPASPPSAHGTLHLVHATPPPHRPP